MKTKYEKLAEELLLNPVLAAEMHLGIENMSPFMKAHLSSLWFMDKEERGLLSIKPEDFLESVWVFSVLRCALIPDHVCVVYWDKASDAAKEYLPFFEVYGVKFNEMILNQSKMVCARDFEFVNGSRLLVMKPNFSQEMAKSMTTMRFNTLITKGISDSNLDLLIGKLTRHSYGFDHPVFKNKRISL